MGFIFISLEPEPEGFVDNIEGVRAINRSKNNAGGKPL